MLHKSARERNRRLKKLAYATKNRYRSGAYFNTKKNRFIKISLNNKEIRTYFNRRYRRWERRMINYDCSAPQNKNEFRKKYNYWNEIL